MRTQILLRVLGALALALVGWQIGSVIEFPQLPVPLAPILAAVGGILGLLFTPWLIGEPFQRLRKTVRQVPAQQLIAATIGLLIGLIIAALTSLPLSFLPQPFGAVLPFVSLVLFGYLGVWTTVTRERDFFALLGGRVGREGFAKAATERSVLLDTSVIIDGRVADISRTGFIEGTMLIPRFVLAELQHIADSPDALRRNRGRRGLEMLNKLQKESLAPIKISDLDVEEVREVDDKLVRLAKKLHCAIMTNDYNLNRVAELQDVRVLNINELAGAVRAIVLPGEGMQVQIVQEGKELGQGVGYLDDGTMVVVDNAKKFIGSVIDVTVTRMLQTNQGRMIFAAPADDKK